MRIFSILALAAFSASCPVQASGQQAPAEIQALIKRTDSLNTACRDSHPSEAAMRKTCGLRDRSVTDLRMKGWCWGHEGQAEFEKTWEPCRSSDRLSTLLRRADLDVSPLWDSPTYAPDWQFVPAANGRYYLVDTSWTRSAPGGYLAMVWVEDRGLNMMVFDCHGSYGEAGQRSLRPFSPNSIAAQISRLTCQAIKEAK